MSLATEVPIGPVTAGSIAARLERLPFSRWHVKARVLIGTATFFDAFDALAIAQVLPVIAPLWKIAPSQIGVLISVGYVGQLIGALLFGYLAERFGRLRAISGAIFIFSVGSLLCAAAGGYDSFMAARFIQGFGLGGEVPIAAVYISEIAKAGGRGRFVLLYENIFSVGVVITSLIGSILVPALGWQSMFLIGGIPIVFAIIIPKALPESPRWLASRDRLKEADVAVREIEQQTRLATGQPLADVGVAVEVEKKRASWRDLIGGIYLGRSLVVWTIWFASFLVYYSLNIWLPTIYRTVFNVPLDQALKLGILSSICSLAGTLVAAFSVDQLGRRPAIAASLACAAFCLFGLWGLGASSLTEVVTLGCAACFFAGIAGMTVYVYTPEIYPTRMRAVGTSIGSAFLRIGSIVGPMIVGSAVSKGVAFVCLVFGIIAIVAAVVVLFFAVETAQKSLEELSP